MTTLNTEAPQRPYRHYLREWRVYRGLSQDHLGRLIGSSKGVVSRYESGDRAMSLETQFRLMQALQITPAQFFSPPDRPSADALLENASPSDRQRAVDIVKLFIDGTGGR